MSCCKKSDCKNAAAQNLPTSEFNALDTFAAAKVAMTKLLSVAHLNNKILPGDISPLYLANLIADLIRRQPAQPPASDAPTPAAQNRDFILRFGPNKAYELHLPGGSSTTPEIKDPQKFFDFDRT